MGQAPLTAKRGQGKVRATYLTRLVRAIVHGGGSMKIVRSLLCLVAISVVPGCSDAPAPSAPGQERSRTVAASAAGQAIPRELIDAGDVGAIAALLDAGADPDAPSAMGIPPLMIAIAMRKDAVVDLLLERGVDVNRGSERGETPLSNAVIANRLELGKRLVAAGANLDDTAAALALGTAAHMGFDPWIRFLVDSGVSPDAADERGTMALHRAASRRNVETMALLLELGAAPDLTNPQNRAPLIEAAEAGCVACVELLLDAGADIDRASAVYRYTPLLAATTKRRPEVVALLIARGADPSLTDDEGLTALDHARRMQDDALVQLLE